MPSVRKSTTGVWCSGLVRCLRSEGPWFASILPAFVTLADSEKRRAPGQILLTSPNANTWLFLSGTLSYAHDKWGETTNQRLIGSMWPLACEGKQRRKRRFPGSWLAQTAAARESKQRRESKFLRLASVAGPTGRQTEEEKRFPRC